jgi:hypothetical protein
MFVPETEFAALLPGIELRTQAVDGASLVV